MPRLRERRCGAVVPSRRGRMSVTATCTIRRRSWRDHQDKNSRNVAVGTTKRSAAMICSHDWRGRSARFGTAAAGCRLMYLVTVA